MKVGVVQVVPLAEGSKLVIISTGLENTGTATANVTNTVTVPVLENIHDVVGVVREDANNSNVVVTVEKPNKIVVTAQDVPAGATTYVRVAVIGF